MRLSEARSIHGSAHETVTLLSMIQMATGMRLCNATGIHGSVHETVTLLSIIQMSTNTGFLTQIV
jgi:hypothetical protein